jgi:hypothetical protein
MLPAIAVKGGELLAAVVVAGVVCAAALAVGMRWLKRRARRRLEAIGRAVAGRAAGAAAAAGSAGWRWLWSRPLPDHRWIAAVTARRRLWRAVGAAEHAVAQARKAGAPTGDLDGLCRQLHHAAADADRSLAMAGRATAPAGQRGPTPEVTDLLAAAGMIQDIAAYVVASVSQPAARGLAEDVRREAEALSAGIASASPAAASGLPGEPA